jgi:hypothetical protein
LTIWAKKYFKKTLSAPLQLFKTFSMLLGILNNPIGVTFKFVPLWLKAKIQASPPTADIPTPLKSAENCFSISTRKK